MNVKEQIYRVENDMPMDPNRPDYIVPEERKAENIEGLQGLIDYYEALLPDAIDKSELQGASYELDDRGTAGFQANMEVYTDGLLKGISFVNWDQDRTIGSIFMIDANESVYKGAAIAELVMPESLEDDEKFLEIKKKTDEYVKGMEYRLYVSKYGHWK